MSSHKHSRVGRQCRGTVNQAPRTPSRTCTQGTAVPQPWSLRGFILVVVIIVIITAVTTVFPPFSCDLFDCCVFVCHRVLSPSHLVVATPPTASAIVIVIMAAAVIVAVNVVAVVIVVVVVVIVVAAAIVIVFVVVVAI